MSALMYETMGKHTYYFCPYCAFHHKTVDVVEKHKKDCKAEKRTLELMPEEGSVIKFDIWREGGSI